MRACAYAGKWRCTKRPEAVALLELEVQVVVGTKKWNSGPLEERQVLLTTEPCLQSLKKHLNINSVGLPWVSKSKTEVCSIGQFKQQITAFVCLPRCRIQSLCKLPLPVIIYDFGSERTDMRCPALDRHRANSLHTEPHFRPFGKSE